MILNIQISPKILISPFRSSINFNFFVLVVLVLTTQYLNLYFSSRAYSADNLTCQCLGLFFPVFCKTSQNDSEGVYLAQKYGKIWDYEGTSITHIMSICFTKSFNFEIFHFGVVPFFRAAARDCMACGRLNPPLLQD